MMNQDVIVNDYNLWWEYYGLTQDPFAADPEQEFYYESMAREQHLDLLHLLVRHSYELVVIQGEAGIGKTTLADVFIESIEQQLTVCYIEAQASTTAHDLLNQMKRDFQLNTDDKQSNTIESQLTRMINSSLESRNKFLLIVDNAEQLPATALAAILFLQQFRWQQEAPLAIILFAENKFIDRIITNNKVSLENDMIKVLQLMPFELQETEDYLNQRLAAAGSEGPLPISNEDIIRIHQRSGGMPGAINEIAEKIMIENLSDMPQHASSFWNSHLDKIKWAGTIFIILLAILFLWHKPKTDPLAQAQLAPAVSTNLATADNANAVNSNQTLSQQTLPDIQEQKPMMDVTPTTAANVQPATVADVPSNQSMNNQNMAANNAAVANSANAVNNVASNEVASSSATTAQPVANNEMQPIADTTQAVKPNSQMASVSNNQPAPITAESPKPAAVTQTHEVTKVSAKQAVTAKASASQKTHITKAKPLTTLLSSSNVFAMPKGNYTIQLMGVSKQNSAQNFIKQQHLSSSAHYYRSKRAGKEFYIIIYGQYPSMQAAKLAMKRLPAAVQHQHPWLRSVASIQKELRKYHS